MKRKNFKKQIQIYSSLLISATCIFWVFSSVEKSALVENFSSIKATPLLFAVIITICSYIIRAYRWEFFFHAKPMSFAKSFQALIIGFFFNNILPARMGEFVRAHLGGKATGLSRAFVLATIAGERIADGLLISLIFALLYILGGHHYSDSSSGEIIYVAYAFLLISLCLVIALTFSKHILHLLDRSHSILPNQSTRYAVVKIRRFLEGLEPLSNPKRLSAVAALSILVWTAELTTYYFVTLAFNQDFSLSNLSLFLAAVNFSSLIPAAPGGIGVIEAFATLALVRVGINREAALSMVTVQHIIQYLVVGIPGAFFFFLRLGGTIPRRENEDSLTPDKNPNNNQSFSINSIPPRANCKPRLSIIIPAYNEEARISSTLKSIIDYCSTLNSESEIIVVSDGSVDKTVEVTKSFQDQFPYLSIYEFSSNRGKGFAVKTGMLYSRGAYALFCDADGSTPIEQVSKLIEALEAGAQVAIGSRAIDTNVITLQTKWYRIAIGRVFNTLVNILVLPGIADTQCGFKLFTREAVEKLFPQLTSERFTFDVEILLLAKYANYKIKEIPVNWHAVPGSKVNLATDSLQMFIDIFKIRFKTRKK